MPDEIGPYDPKVFVLHDRDGLQILLPRSFKITDPSDPFFAVDRNGADLQIIQKNADRLGCGIFAPLDRGTAYQVRVLREGEIANPYPGFERLCESKFLLNGRRYFRWNCLLRPKDAPAALFFLHAQEIFAQREAIWTRMFESIRLGNATPNVSNITEPQNKNLLVLRTDFSADSAWKAICDAVQKNQAHALFDYVSNAENEGLSDGRLVDYCRRNGHKYVFLVDKKAVENSEHSILALDIDSQRKFRLLPSEAWAVASNLSIANMDFEDFADAVDADGVFRGFPRI